LISASVIGIMFILGKLLGNESFKNEITFPSSNLCMFNFSEVVKKKLLKVFATVVWSFTVPVFTNEEGTCHCSCVHKWGRDLSLFLCSQMRKGPVTVPVFTNEEGTCSTGCVLTVSFFIIFHVVSFLLSDFARVYHRIAFLFLLLLFSNFTVLGVTCFCFHLWTHWLTTSQQLWIFWECRMCGGEGKGKQKFQ